MPGRAGRGGRGQPDRDADSAGETGEDVLAPITPEQQRFIEALLTGKSIAAAARLAGISRRAATYWMASENHPVTIEYMKQRALALAELDRRVATLYELTFQAIEQLLSSETPPFIRIQAVKMLWDRSLSEMFTVKQPQSAGDLAHKSAREYYDKSQENYTLVMLWDDKGKPRIVD